MRVDAEFGHTGRRCAPEIVHAEVGKLQGRTGTLQQLVVSAPMTMRMLVDETLPCRAFRS